jgi:ribonuclease PH
VDLKALGERQIKIDCDVLQADGGTRTASITGAYVALYQAFRRLVHIKKISEIPFIDSVSAVSCGILKADVLLDLDYNEDSSADVDANFVITGSGKLVEVQASAEKKAFSEEDFSKMLALARQGADFLRDLQRSVLK